MTPLERAPLAPRCTLGIGGPARFLVEARSEAEVLEAAALAERHDLPLLVLGQGSNVVVADAGVEAVVVGLGLRGVAVRHENRAVEVTAAAGESWDQLVHTTVERGWAGLECLSGIPGLVGATPIQNVGAYGQDVGAVVSGVRVLERGTGRVLPLAPSECGFGYRESAFRRSPGRAVVLAVTYRLAPGGAPAVRYTELAQRLARAGLVKPALVDVRSAVLAIRREKSMVLDAGDENRRSCGSFFLNPVVPAADCPRIEAAAGDPAMPRWPEADGRVKLSAAWLIERAGFRRGERAGSVGLSTRHSLAVVAHAGARAADVVRFARRLRDGVEARLGVRLVPEPVFWGFERSEDDLPSV
ncbi:MAG: UDP-N-acetylenolpyruvoylglucosamine reductase [Candidatus Rokuibacteriota bacterium]|nr:MAG: UDP-N-acetylenolpyruvoylglucosamine reductase [Candidatus Rokubacteria bacterium]